MAADGVFHIGPDGELISMTVTPCDAEDLLQALLETHPDLLAGGQMTPESPRRWALVRREPGAPHRGDSGGCWSVNHLFVDQDAVPTLVEVKRSADPRIRREVIGQMLDYAANGLGYWPVESLRAAYEATQHDLGRDPRERLVELCGGDPVEVGEFFERVGDNLLAGRIRMVFVADVIPDELRRIAEFLNEQMSPAEVFAVEVTQYRADGYDGTVIVPAVYGRTAAARKNRSGSGSLGRVAATAASEASTRTALTLVADWVESWDHDVVDTVAGAMGTASDQTVASVYLAAWNGSGEPREPPRHRGHPAEPEALLTALSRTASARVTSKLPNLPSEEALEPWDELRPIVVEIARLYQQND